MENQCVACLGCGEIEYCEGCNVEVDIHVCEEDETYTEECEECEGTGKAEET